MFEYSSALTASDDERARLPVHGETAEHHRALGLDRQPEIENGAVIYLCSKYNASSYIYEILLDNETRPQAVSKNVTS